MPVLIGVCLGFVAGPHPGRRAAGWMAAGAVTGGVLVAWVTGELAESVGFALIDAGVALLALALTLVARRMTQRARKAARPG